MAKVEVIGRIVWGHPMKPQDVKDDNGNIRTGKDGQPLKQWTFGLAIPKAEFGPIGAAMQAAVAEEFPGGQVPGNFAWKTKDGDTDVNSQGAPLRDKPGYAGCFVLSVSSFFAINTHVFDYGANAWRQAKEGDLKTGDFVKVLLDLKAHKARNSKEKPGLYVNPDAVCFWQHGEEIKSRGFDPNAGNVAAPPPPQPPAAPPPGVPAAPGGFPGAGVPSAPPQAPAAAPGGFPGAGVPAAAPGGFPGAASVNPHTAFLNGPPGT